VKHESTRLPSRSRGIRSFGEPALRRGGSIRDSRQRAFVTLSALILVMLLGMVVVSLTMLFTTRGERTKRAPTETQVRQLLTAGAAASQAIVAGWDAEQRNRTWSVGLPESLKDDGVAVLVSVESVVPGVERRVTVEVNFNDRTSAQALRYVLARDAWVMIEATRGR